MSTCGRRDVDAPASTSAGSCLSALRADDDVDAACAPEERARLPAAPRSRRRRRSGARAGSPPLRANLAEARVELLFGALAHAAGVDDDDVGVARRRPSARSLVLEQARHALGVVEVHLTAERLDEVLTRHARPFAFAAATFAFAFCLRFAFARRRVASISRADASTCGETAAPAIMRASSSSRPASSSSRDARSSCGPPRTCLAIWKCASARAAICGRCVMQST